MDLKKIENIGMLQLKEKWRSNCNPFWLKKKVLMQPKTNTKAGPFLLLTRSKNMITTSLRKRSKVNLRQGRRLDLEEGIKVDLKEFQN